jgi:hypothetical protein
VLLHKPFVDLGSRYWVGTSVGIPGKKFVSAKLVQKKLSALLPGGFQPNLANSGFHGETAADITRTPSIYWYSISRKSKSHFFCWEDFGTRFAVCTRCLKQRHDPNVKAPTWTPKTMTPQDINGKYGGNCPKGFAKRYG